MSTKPHLSQIQSTDKDKHQHLLSEILFILDRIDLLADKGVKGVFDSYDDMVAGASEIGFYNVIIDETFKNYPTGYYYDGSNFHMNYGLNLVLDILDDRLVIIEDELVDVSDKFGEVEAVLESLELKDIELDEGIELLKNALEELGELVTGNAEDILELDGKIITTSSELGSLKDDLVGMLGDWESDTEIEDKLTKGISNVRDIIGVEGLRRTVVFYIQSFGGEGKSVNIFVPYKGELKKLYISIPEPSDIDLLCRFTVDNIVEDITLPAGDRRISLDLEGNFDDTNCIFTILSGGEVEGINASLDFIQVN